MGNPIKRLAKIKDDHICLDLLIKRGRFFMVSCEDLSLTASLGSESVLAVIQDIVAFQVFHGLGDNDVFQQLATQIC